MGVDENKTDFMEEKEMNEILDSAISEMLGRIKQSLEEERAVKPPPPPVVSMPAEEPQKLAKVLEDLGVQTDAIAMDGEKKMQYQINIQEHARPACSPLHINLSLPPHSCPQTTPSSSPAPAQAPPKTTEPEKEAKSAKDASVQTVKTEDDAIAEKAKEDAQKKEKLAAQPIHINVTMPHVCQPQAVEPPPQAVEPPPAAPQPEATPEQEKEPPKELQETGVQCNILQPDTKKEEPEAETKEEVPPETPPAAAQPEVTPEEEKKFEEIGVQCDSVDIDGKEDEASALTVKLIIEEGSVSTESREGQKGDKPVETVSVQTEETAADREKPVLYDINIKEHARPENTPLRINFKLPAHTCPKSTGEPSSDEASPATTESPDSQKEDEGEDTDGVGVQTLETGDERLQPVQYKINIQEHKRPATSPLHITVNQPLHTCPGSTAQSPPATSQPGSQPPKRPIIMKELSVQTDENGAEKPSTNQQQTNGRKQSSPGCSPIHINVDVPPHDCQPPTAPSAKRQSVKDIPDSSQPPKRPQQIGDTNAQSDDKNGKTMTTEVDKNGLVCINVKVPPHTCTQQKGNSNLDNGAQDNQGQSKPAASNKDVDRKTNGSASDNSKPKDTEIQKLLLPDGTPLYITLHRPSQTPEDTETQPTSAGRTPAGQEQSKPAASNKDVGMQTNGTSSDDSKTKRGKIQKLILSDGTFVYITSNTLPQTCKQPATQPDSASKTTVSANRRQSKPAASNKDVDRQTNGTSDDSKSKESKIQKLVLADGTPIYITLNTPPHTCNQAATQPTSAGRTPAGQEQSKPAASNKDVGMQTNGTPSDDLKSKQSKVQKFVLADGTPLYITLNTPQSTCKQAATQPTSGGKTPADPANKSRSREDVGVQADEMLENSKMTQTIDPNCMLPDGSPLHFPFNRPPKTTVQPTLNRKIPGCHMVSCPIRPRTMKCCCRK